MAGEVVFERRRRPIDFRVLKAGVGIATLVPLSGETTPGHAVWDLRYA